MGCRRSKDGLTLIVEAFEHMGQVALGKEPLNRFIQRDEVSLH
jgi:hypothetical protein